MKIQFSFKRDMVNEPLSRRLSLPELFTCRVVVENVFLRWSCRRSRTTANNFPLYYLPTEIIAGCFD